MQHTTKKVKVIGTETYLNPKTGELQEMLVTDIEERDFNFTKVWMRDFLSKIDLIGNQKVKVANWIIENINKENQLVYSQRDIAKKADVSLDTVNVTIKILQDADFIRKQGKVYIINPDILYKGTKNGRVNVLSQYHDAPIVKLSKAEKIANITRSIEHLQKELEKLQNEEPSSKTKSRKIFGQNAQKRFEDDELGVVVNG